MEIFQQNNYEDAEFEKAVSNYLNELPYGLLPIEDADNMHQFARDTFWSGAEYQKKKLQKGGNTIISTKDYLKLKKNYSKMQLLLIEIQTAIDYEEMDKDSQSYFNQKLNILIKESTEL